MIGYETLIYDLVVYFAPSMVVFLMLAIILDFLRQYIFNAKI